MVRIHPRSAGLNSILIRHLFRAALATRWAARRRIAPDLALPDADHRTRAAVSRPSTDTRRPRVCADLPPPTLCILALNSAAGGRGIRTRSSHHRMRSPSIRGARSPACTRAGLQCRGRSPIGRDGGCHVPSLALSPLAARFPRWDRPVATDHCTGAIRTHADFVQVHRHTRC